MKKQVRIWVNPNFANALKHEAIERHKSLLEFTKDITEPKSYIEQLAEKWRKQKI